MAVGDKYHCNKCGLTYTAQRTLFTKSCQNVTCQSEEVVLLKKREPEPPRLPPKEEVPLIPPGGDFSDVPSLVFRSVPKDDDKSLDEAIHKLEFKESNIDIDKEEKKMSREDKQEGWSGTSAQEYDPESDFKAILKDIGLKNKVGTISRMFFTGDIDKPEWLDECLKVAGVDVARRRLAIAGYFGHIPDELKKDEDTDDKKEEKSESDLSESKDPIKDAYKKIKLAKAERLLEMQADMDMAVMEENLKKRAKETSGSADKPKEDVVRIPMTDDNGKLVTDEKGAPVIMELSKGDLPLLLLTRGSHKDKEPKDDTMKQLLLQSQNQIAELQKMYLQKASEGNKPDERAIAEKKYWEERAERERKEREEFMRNSQKEREEMLKMVQGMKEEFLHKEIEDLHATVRAVNKPIEQQLGELKEKGLLAQNMGLIATGVDPKTQVQTEIARGISQEFAAGSREMREQIRQGVQEGLLMVKDERKKQHGGNPSPELSITKEDKDTIYAKMQAKMEEERRLMAEERARIDSAKAEFERRANEFEDRWSNEFKKREEESKRDNTPPPAPPPEQPRSPEEVAKELGVVEPAPVQSEPKSTEPVVAEQKDLTKEEKVDILDKKLKEMERK